MYDVRFVDDHELPADHDWMILRVDETYIAVIKLSRLTTRVLEEAWVGYAQLAERRFAWA